MPPPLVVFSTRKGRELDGVDWWMAVAETE